MIRPSTKGDFRAFQSPDARPHTAAQAAIPPSSWYTSYMRVLNDHRRVIIRQTKRPDDVRPLTTALGRRVRDCVSAEPPASTEPENRAKATILSPKESEVPLTATAALMRFGHNQRPALPSAKDTLADYIIGTTLGQGSFASVKRAVHKQTNQTVAIKTYEKYRLIDAHRKKGVAREVQILSQLDHYNVVKLIKVMEGPRHLHLVMEFVDGPSLYTYLKHKESKRLTEADAKEIFKQMMDGLAYLHEKGVAHRDLKLQNVLLDQKRVVKIIDFGFSTQATGDRKVKMYCGTPNYMAPEIVERKEYLGGPADIWAAGVFLFAILCGEFPFKGLSDRELYKRIQAGVFLIPPHVSLAAKELIAAMLTVDPDLRPAARAVLSSSWLTSIKSAQSVPSLRPGTTPALFRQRSSAIANPLAGYDQDIMTRLVTDK